MIIYRSFALLVWSFHLLNVTQAQGNQSPSAAIVQFSVLKTFLPDDGIRKRSSILNQPVRNDVNLITPRYLHFSTAF